MANLTPADRLKYVLDLGFTHPMFSTSLGQEDQVLTDCIALNQLPIEIFTLLTGRLFQETLKLLEQTEKKYGISIKRFKPDELDVAKLVTSKGEFSFYQSVENRVECCDIRKVRPLMKALESADLWITGLRGGQSSNRKDGAFLEYDSRWSIHKFNPLIDHKLSDIQDIITENHIPENPLHLQGYLSIGCRPCTRAVYPDEDIRAGRWWWENSKKECGLHR